MKRELLEMLGDLAADVAAHVADQQQRGQVGWDPSQQLPETEPVLATDGDESSPNAPQTSGAAVRRPSSRQAGLWATVAESARAEEEEETALGAQGLDRIRADLGDCRRCGLCTERTQLVYGVGNPDADLVVVGEAPGFQEDRRGEPFVGPAGQMLDAMLANVLGLPRAAVYIVNVVKCRPPRNRNPLPDEVAACMPFLERQIAAVRPKVMLVLGTVAFKSLFDTTAGITRSRGKWREWKEIPVMPTFHPAYLLRNPAEKRKTFDDLKAVKQRYDEVGGRRP